MSVLRGERKPGKKWTTTDRMFALALNAFEADLCNGCGQPMSMSSGEHPHDYQIERTRCMACAEVEEDREGSRKPESGEKTYVIRDE